MISKHCGKKLKRYSPDSSPQHKVVMHFWKCQGCGRVFSQKVRLSREASTETLLLAALL